MGTAPLASGISASEHQNTDQMYPVIAEYFIDRRRQTRPEDCLKLTQKGCQIFDRLTLRGIGWRLEDISESVNREVSSRIGVL